MISGEYQCHLFLVSIAKECTLYDGLGSPVINADSVFVHLVYTDIAVDMEVDISVVNVLLDK